MIIPLETKVQGLISAQVLNSTGEIVREVPEFCNLITNAGLDTLAGGASSGTSLFTVCKVGTGSGVPAVGDTTLSGGIANVSGYTGSISTQTTAAPYYMDVVHTYLFPIGAINATLTCIGMGIATNNTEAKCWSQIKDSGGIPTTLQVLATEQLQVIYKIRMYAPAFPITGTAVITNAGTYNYSAYYYNFGSAWALGGDVGVYSSAAISYEAHTWTTFTPPSSVIGNYSVTGGSLSTCTTCTPATYTAGTYYRDVALQWASTAGNVGGIKGIRMATASGRIPFLIIDLGGTIAKDSTKVLNITLRFSVARYS